MATPTNGGIPNSANLYTSPLLDDLYADQAKKVTLNAGEARLLNNAYWVNECFFTPRDRLIPVAQNWIYGSSADGRYVDATWGGSFAVNIRPQWTPLADPRRKGTVLERKSGFDGSVDPILDIRDLGAGRLYIEQFEDNVQRVYFRFGVPAYNDLVSFLGSMSSSDAVSIATTGSSRHLSPIINKTIAAAFIIPRIPIMGVMMLFTQVSGFLFGKKIWDGGQAFYALKTVQGNYWGSVQAMINEFITAAGFLEYRGVATKLWNWAKGEEEDVINTGKEEYLNAEGGDPTFNKRNNLPAVALQMDDVFNEHLGFSVLAAVSKAARRSAIYLNKLNDIAKNETNPLVNTSTYLEGINKQMNVRASGAGDVTVYTAPDMFIDYDAKNWGMKTFSKDNLGIVLPDITLERGGGLPSVTVNYGAMGHIFALFQVASMTAMYTMNVLEEGEQAAAIAPASAPVDPATFVPKTDVIDALDLVGNAKASRNPAAAPPEGATPNDVILKERIDVSNKRANDAIYQAGIQYVAFDVTYAGAVQEGVSSSVMPHPLSSMFNSVAGTARSVKMAASGGNLTGTVVESLLKWGIGTLGNVALDAANFLTMNVAGNLVDILQGANIDLPQFWESSTVQLPTASYTIQLRAAGGDFLSQLKSVYFPLFCIIAGAFPQGTGGASHVHPFYCQVYDKGRLNKNLAMITNITISRGVSNTGFNDNFQALGIDVTIEVTDLAPIMSVPVMPGLLQPGDPMTEYLWTLASVNMNTYLNGATRIGDSIERYSRRLDTLLSPGYIQNQLVQILNGAGLSFLTNATLAAGLGTAFDTAGLDPRKLNGF